MTVLHYSAEQLIKAKSNSPISTPSHQKAATAVALGLWEPAKHATPDTFALKPSAPVYKPQQLFGLEESIHNPFNDGQPPVQDTLAEVTYVSIYLHDQHPSPAPSLFPSIITFSAVATDTSTRNIPPGFVHVHLGLQDSPSKPAPVFPINRDLLTQYCGHFRQNASFSPSTQSFHLQAPEHDTYDIKQDALTLLFPIFNTWLHQGGALVTRDGTPATHLSLLKLCRLYVFGILLEAPLFSNAVVDVIKRKRQVFSVFDHSAVEDAVMYVYGLPYMLLRAAVVDFVVVNTGPWIVVAFEWPSIAKKDMLDALFEGCRERVERRVREERCRYHVHSPEDVCS